VDNVSASLLRSLSVPDAGGNVAVAMIEPATIAAPTLRPAVPARTAGDPPREEPAPRGRQAPGAAERPSVRASRALDGGSLVQAQEAREPPPGELTDEEQRIVRELRRIDAEVRRHEQAHRTAGGPYAGAPKYQYTRGPDGHLYAVSGEVSIDIGREASPQATIRKMTVVIRAALAPVEPSAQDRSVANQAKQIKLEAQAELRAERQEQQQGGDEESLSPAISSTATQPDAAAQAYRDAAAVVARSATTGADIAFSTQA
jgi:hypothetical protein